jgi:hypothetical protein
MPIRGFILSAANHEGGDMNKFSCTRSLGEEIYYATLIAENEQQAREMAVLASRAAEPRGKREEYTRSI